MVLYCVLVCAAVLCRSGLSVTTPRGQDATAADPGLTADGSQVVWDQEALNARPTAFVFSPSASQLSVSVCACQAWTVVGALSAQRCVIGCWTSAAHVHCGPTQLLIVCIAPPVILCFVSCLSTADAARPISPFRL